MLNVSRSLTQSFFAILNLLLEKSESKDRGREWCEREKDEKDGDRERERDRERE